MRNYPPGAVLITAPTGRDAALAAEALKLAKIEAQVFANLAELAAAISPGAGAVLLAEESLADPQLDAFLDALKAQEPWSDLPILLMTRGEASRDRIVAVARLAPATFVTQLERPFRAATLISNVEGALRARNRQWQVRDLFNQRNAAQEALAENEDRMRMATEGANVGLWDFFPESGRLIWNDVCRAHFGLAPGTPITYEVFLAGLHPDDREPSNIAVTRALSSPHDPTYAIEYRTIAPGSGTERWIAATGRAHFDATGKAVRFTGTTVEITERKRVTLELSEAHRFLHSAIDALSSHIAVLDEHGVILAVNEAWRHFADLNDYDGGNYGIGARYLQDPHLVGDGCHEDDRVTTGLNAVLEGREDRFELEYPCHSPTEQRWFVMRVTRFPTPGPRRVVVAHENVTERKLVEEALREAKHQAEAANAAKDHFLATLSHELRTPLTPVLMCLSDRASDPAVSEDLREDLAMILRNVQLEARLIDDLLDVTRISRGKLELHAETLDLHEILRETLDIYAGADTARRRLVIELENRAEQHHVLADRARLKQVFWNLLNNALKFSPDGGRVTVRTRNPSPSRIIIQVRDTGIGIEPEKIPFLFDAFEQGSRTITKRFGGLGLGLAICRALVGMHGGHLTAESEGPGRGSTFIVELDTCHPGKSEDTSMPLDDGITPRPLHILLVEDHAATLTILCRLLRRAGHVVTPASTLREARTFLGVHTFDLLISDLGLPDGSGIDLVREPRARAIPSIALSGYGMEDDVSECLAAGFHSHVTKPVDWPWLTATISKVTTRPAALS